MMSSVFRAGVFCPPKKAGVGVIYIALERMQPEEIFRHNELSQVPNEKCLQGVHPILPTGKINHLIPGGWSYMRAWLQI